MIARFNRISLLYGIPGILLQIAAPLVGYWIVPDVPQFQGVAAELQAVVALIGTSLLLAGLAYHAKAKGRSPWWCLLAFFSCIGWLGLALLQDRSAAKS